MALASGAARGLWLSRAEEDDLLLARFADRALSQDWDEPGRAWQPRQSQSARAQGPRDAV